MLQRGKYLGISLLILIGILWSINKLFPLDLSRYHDVSTVIYGADKQILHVFLTKDEKYRLSSTLTKVTPLYIQTLIQREDKFYRLHCGVNPFSLLRASFQYIKNGYIVSGGSTITMQTARLLTLPKKRTISVKIQEILRALQLEWYFTKDEIINIYLTLAPLGSNIEGVSAAAYAYFNKHPNQLNPAEIALLVSLVQSPSHYRPDRFPQKAMLARQRVLQIMHSTGLITEKDFRLYTKEPLPKILHKFPQQIPHLAWRLRQRYQQHEILSTIDSVLQTKVEKLLENYRSFLPQGANAAILIFDLHHNQPVVYIASTHYLDTAQQGYVDYITAMRSPGSTLKPFIYAMAFDLGIIKPTDYVLDIQRRFGAYYPHNFDKDIHGNIEAQEALALSLNIPAVSLLNKIGVIRFLGLLKQAGVEPRFPKSFEGPSLPTALGGLSVSLEQLVSLYSVLANKGKHTLFSTSIFSENTAQQITEILMCKECQRKIAIKTGTSYGHRDALALGYDNQFVVGIWIGKPNGTPMYPATGASVAIPLLKKIFTLLPQASTDIILSNKKKPESLKPFRMENPEIQSRMQVPSLLFPVDGSVITLETPLLNQTIPCKIGGGVKPFTWYINNQPIATQCWQQLYFWEPKQAGYYTITVIDAQGQRASVSIEIRI